MSALSIKKVLALPGTYEPSTLYMVTAADPNHVEMYISSSDGATVRRVLTKADMDAAIATAVSGLGGGGSSVIFNSVTRYEALTSTGLKVHCLSSSTNYTGLTWSRAAAVMTINHVGHGRSVGDRVILKDVNVPVLNTLITGVTADTFTVACADAGSTGTSDGKYTNGFRYAHNSEVPGALTSGQLFAPANCDIQLISMRIHTKANSRAGATYDITMPTSVYAPVGEDTSNDDTYVPHLQIRSDADAMAVVGNTLAMNQGGSYSTFRIGALGSVTQGQLILMSL